MEVKHFFQKGHVTTSNFNVGNGKWPRDTDNSNFLALIQQSLRAIFKNRPSDKWPQSRDYNGSDYKKIWLPNAKICENGNVAFEKPQSRDSCRNSVKKMCKMPKDLFL